MLGSPPLIFVVLRRLINQSANMPRYLVRLTYLLTMIVVTLALLGNCMLEVCQI